MVLGLDGMLISLLVDVWLVVMAWLELVVENIDSTSVVVKDAAKDEWEDGGVLLDMDVSSLVVIRSAPVEAAMLWRCPVV